jgi:hypothetical protein
VLHPFAGREGVAEETAAPLEVIVEGLQKRGVVLHPHRLEEPIDRIHRLGA